MFGLQKKQGCRSSQKNGFVTGLASSVVTMLLIGQSPVVASALEAEIATLKAEASAYAADMAKLEERVLQPVDTRMALFLTLANSDGLDLDSVELFVNGKPAASHLYTPRESGSLQQGGIQKLFTGNLVNGTHELKAVITARAANDRFVRREAFHRFQKKPGKLRLKVALEARAPDYEPRVSFVEGPQLAPSALKTGLEQFAEASFGWIPELPDNRSPQPKSKQQKRYEEAELARAAGDLEAAGKVLATMDEGYWSAVGYLNLSADYARRDLKPSRALVALRVALAMADKDADPLRQSALRSRILLRAGYLAYTNSEFEKAIGFLEKIPLDSHKIPQALYFHGLALAEQGKHRAAMQSWHRAKKYPLAYPGVAYAWIGMGRGYDLSGYLGQAGEAYLAANAAYEGERVTLRTLASQVGEQGAYKALVLNARSQIVGTAASGGAGSGTALYGSRKVEWFLADSRTLTQPRMAYLLTLMERPAAQVAVDRVAGLAQMAAEFQRNAENLDVFTIAIKEELQRLGGTQAGQVGNLQQLLADTQALRNQSLKHLDTVKELRVGAEAELDRLALDFVAAQDQKMVYALDKTEQQIAHLYEYLALQGLEHGDQDL
ncbi:tetratricopeptide repeat protein [Marinobacter salexigens]|uniref:tetratricopeptide repeat protein n=1 Tax=Marinobacter salexigens TaxID=1925763 RepID=UPI001EFE6B14|nr:hypothetical protein [Marinobacter salexigens]